VAPDGKRVAVVYFPGKDPRFSADHVAVLNLDGTGEFRIFDAFPSDETTVGWSVDGSAVDYIINMDGVGNLWRQPLRGGAPAPVTSFRTDEMFAFAWSRDGRLACARGATTRGVVLLENVR
jgi:Tol biopolymer transport system component